MKQVLSGVQAFVRRLARKDCEGKTMRVRIDFPNGLPSPLKRRLEETQSFEANLESARKVINIGHCRLKFSDVSPFREITASCSTDEFLAFRHGQGAELQFRCKIDGYKVGNARLVKVESQRRRFPFLAARM